MVARRIKCDLTENQLVKAGERFGIIRFGSRLDVSPERIQYKINEGQTSISGETILVDFKLSKLGKKFLN